MFLRFRKGFIADRCMLAKENSLSIVRFVQDAGDFWPASERTIDNLRRDGMEMGIRLMCVSIVLSMFAAAPLAAAPVVSMPENIEAAAGGKVTVPVNIQGVQGAQIGGYFIRLVYDESVLANPTVVSQGTLSADNPRLNSAFGKTHEPWTFSVWLGFGFAPDQDGVLIKVEFDVSPRFAAGNTPIRFAGPNEDSILIKDVLETDFNQEIIPSEFGDGSISAAQGAAEDAFDYGLFQEHWLTRCSDSNWDPQYDYVPDCIVDYRDLSYVGDTFFPMSSSTSMKSFSKTVSFSRTVDIATLTLPKDLSLIAGQFVEVPVGISPASIPELWGYSLRLHYDPSVLTNPEIVTQGTRSETSGDRIELVEAPADDIGSCAVSIYNLKPDPGEDLVKVKFQVSPDFDGGEVFVSFASPNVKSTLFQLGFYPMQANFTPATCDIDNDGDITLSDAVAVFSVLAGADAGPIEKASDYNGNKRIDVAEAGYVLRYLSGNMLGK